MVVSFLVKAICASSEFGDAYSWDYITPIVQKPFMKNGIHLH